MRGYNPTEILRQIKTRRISVLVSVPGILELLREHILQRFPELRGQPPSSGGKWYRRWWKHRRVHNAFGWKFWAFVVGAAPLPADIEAFWTSLGFLVIQGYGLTETAPIVTLNHPFHASQGTVGKPIGGVQVNIADDGEILVRGANVTSGYYNAPEQTAEVFDAEGWFHTGDIGAMDREGRAYHSRAPQGNDRHARGPQRVPGRCRTGAQSACPASATPRSSEPTAYTPS